MAADPTRFVPTLEVALLNARSPPVSRAASNTPPPALIAEMLEEEEEEEEKDSCARMRP